MKKLRDNLKVYTVRKYIIARSASEAIKLEKTKSVDDVFCDYETQISDLRNTSQKEPGDIGFKN